MALDPVVNFGKVVVSTGYDDIETTIVLSSGEGAKLPSTFPYNLVWWNSTDYADPSDDPSVEIIRVPGRSTDTLNSILRAQEGTAATTKNAAGKTYKMLLGMTKKMVDDLAQNGTNADITSITNLASLTIVNGTLGAAAANKIQMASEDNGAGNASWLLQPESGTALRYGNNILDVESGDLTLGSTANQLVLDSGGNVGIGTSSPSSRLHVKVAGETLFDLETTSSNRELLIRSTASPFIGNIASIRFMAQDSDTNETPYAQFGAGVAVNTNGAEEGYIHFDTNLNGSLAEKVRIDASGNVCIGTTTSLGKLHVDQASVANAIPTLYLDQANLSEEMIEFNTVIGTGNPIEAIAAKVLTTTHFIKVTIPGGLTRYIPCGTIA